MFCLQEITDLLDFAKYSLHNTFPNLQIKYDNFSVIFEIICILNSHKLEKMFPVIVLGTQSYIVLKNS